MQGCQVAMKILYFEKAIFAQIFGATQDKKKKKKKHDMKINSEVRSNTLYFAIMSSICPDRASIIYLRAARAKER